MSKDLLYIPIQTVEEDPNIKHVNTKKKNDVINQSETTKPGSVS